MFNKIEMIKKMARGEELTTEELQVWKSNVHIDSNLVDAARSFLTTNPNSQAVYVTWDGRTFDEEAYSKGMSPLAGYNLPFLQRDRFPVLISRTFIKYWDQSIEG